MFFFYVLVLPHADVELVQAALLVDPPDGQRPRLKKRRTRVVRRKVRGPME